MPNLSQLKRERMLAFLQKIKDEHRDDDDMLIALGEIESELTSKKYGLVWEQHEEAVDVMMRDHIPVFTEVPEREITAAPGQGYNFILEGDNLHSRATTFYQGNNVAFVTSKDTKIPWADSQGIYTKLAA